MNGKISEPCPIPKTSRPHGESESIAFTHVDE